MTNDPNAGPGWYAPPSQGALQSAPLVADAPTPVAASPVPLQHTGYVEPTQVHPGYVEASYAQQGYNTLPAPQGYGQPAWGAQGAYPAVWSRPGAKLATPGSRLGALLLDGLLIIVTLFVGWMVWSLVVWGRGTTPAKSLLRQRVIDATTGQTATWGHMAVRQALVGGLLAGLLNTVTFYIYGIVDACMVFGEGHRRLTDRIAKTLVVQD